MITKITSIHIEHIKGIENSTFALNIIPNKPSILVAPNGFGKSSFAIAFDSLQSNRINLNEDNCYKRDISKLPKLKISCIDDSGARWSGDFGFEESMVKPVGYLSFRFSSFSSASISCKAVLVTESFSTAFPPRLNRFV